MSFRGIIKCQFSLRFLSRWDLADAPAERAQLERAEKLPEARAAGKRREVVIERGERDADEHPGREGDGAEPPEGITLRVVRVAVRAHNRH